MGENRLNIETLGRNPITSSSEKFRLAMTTLNYGSKQ